MTREQKKELDELWKQAVFKKYGKVCNWPGCRKTEYVQAHHFVGKSNYRLRWDVRNGVPLCRGHHSFIAHVQYERFRDWFIQTRIKDYLYICIVRNSQTKQDYNLLKLALNDNIRASKKA